jgi:hypothetical protein
VGRRHRLTAGPNTPAVAQSVTRRGTAFLAAAPNPHHAQVTGPGPVTPAVARSARAPVVLTGRVGNTDIDAGTGRTRRRVLGAAAGTAIGAAGATALGGCGLLDDGPQPAPAPDPAQPLLDGARELAAAYDRAIAAQPALAGRLAPIAEAHRAHAGELARVIGGRATATAAAPSPSGPAGEPALSVPALRTAEQRAQRVAATACRTAPANRAALIGSIAAARAAHAEALRGSA